MHIAPMFILM